MRLVLCTGNPGKVKELKELFPSGWELLSLVEVGMPEDLPENGKTLEANALEKAQYVFDRTGIPCLADDTGLEVNALDGAPGVWSARYAGEAKDAKANMAELLEVLKGVMDRSARFRTVIAFVSGDGASCFEGTVEGLIANEHRGVGGFGYDPIFMPFGSEETFAEMDSRAKNAISHRARAMAKAVEYLRDRYDSDRSIR